MIELNVLKDLGLTDTEASVYLANLKIGPETVINIAKKAGVKRTTCYAALDNLLAKGLITKAKKGSSTLYVAEQPGLVLKSYKEKIKNFESLLSYFEAQSKTQAKPKIRYFESKQELGYVYTKILFPPPTEELYIFGGDVTKVYKTFKDYPNFYDKTMEEYFIKRKITMEIVSHNKAGRKYANMYKDKWQIRIMPEDLAVFGDSVVTEDKLFIVSIDHMFGILVESADLAKTYKNIFLLAWRAADKI